MEVPMKATNVLNVIKGQHKTLRENIELLASDDVNELEKQKYLKDFIRQFRLLAEAEEITVYDVLEDICPTSPVVLKAQQEHDVIESLIEQIEDQFYQSGWSPEIQAKVAVMSELVELHFKAEETQLFGLCRHWLTALELEAIGEEFQQKCIDFEERETDMAIALRIQEINRDMGISPRV
jgi:Hemerythrin HHE cation binding domain